MVTRQRGFSLLHEQMPGLRGGLGHGALALRTAMPRTPSGNARTSCGLPCETPLPPILHCPPTAAHLRRRPITAIAARPRHTADPSVHPIPLWAVQSAPSPSARKLKVAPSASQRKSQNEGSPEIVKLASCREPIWGTVRVPSAHRQVTFAGEGGGGNGRLVSASQHCW